MEFDEPCLEWVCTCLGQRSRSIQCWGRMYR